VAKVSVSFKIRCRRAPKMDGMRVGIGLPAAVPDADMTRIGDWAEAAERAGFESAGVIDRLIYDNLDPLTALAAAASRTERILLTTTILCVNWRANPALLAKQLSSVVRLSGGRLVTGMGMGGWPDDYEASGVSQAGKGARFDEALATMARAWEATGARPTILLGGTGPRSFARAATEISDGWVSPLFGLDVLRDGTAAVREAWAEAGREGRPRVMTGRYFSLGEDADANADEYIRHYYGDAYFEPARADTLTTAEQVRAELRRLTQAGCDDVLLFPCSGGLEQVSLLAEAVR
jgi:alkanesulfonate monooxygenase SsuD/methylene tetrahydromethanopterin reductase-like flavin-dependent oxidoreductase (luciferase family)